MAIFLLRGSEASDAIESGLRATIPGLIEVTSLSPILERKPEEHDEPATVLVIPPPGDHGYFDRLVELAAKYRNEMFLILISDEITASNYKLLVRTGGAEWVSAKAGVREVTDIITRRRQQDNLSVRQPPLSAKFQPVTISFIPSAGGVGNTTLIIESAISLKTNKATQQRNICIVDLDFQTSHICDYLDGEARLHIAEFSNAPERLDEHLLESFKTRHPSGIDIFAAPRSKFPSEDMSINALDALFSMIAKRYDLVFIDFPLTWFSWTTPIIAACDGAVITGLNTIPNLRQISETLAIVRASAAALKIAIALNRCDRNLFGSVTGRKQVERVLPNEELFFVGHHPEAADSANMGVPMVLSPSARKLRGEFASLANFCAAVKSSRPVPR